MGCGQKYSKMSTTQRKKSQNLSPSAPKWVKNKSPPLSESALPTSLLLLDCRYLLSAGMEAEGQWVCLHHTKGSSCTTVAEQLVTGPMWVLVSSLCRHHVATLGTLTATV